MAAYLVGGRSAGVSRLSYRPGGPGGPGGGAAIEGGAAVTPAELWPTHTAAATVTPQAGRSAVCRIAERKPACSWINDPHRGSWESVKWILSTGINTATSVNGRSRQNCALPMAGVRWSCAMVVGAAGQLADSLWDSAEPRLRRGHG